MNYVKIGKGNESDNIYALSDEVESDKEDDINNLASNSNIEFVLEKNLENNKVLEQWCWVMLKE